MEGSESAEETVGRHIGDDVRHNVVMDRQPFSDEPPATSQNPYRGASLAIDALPPSFASGVLIFSNFLLCILISFSVNRRISLQTRDGLSASSDMQRYDAPPKPWKFVVDQSLQYLNGTTPPFMRQEVSTSGSDLQPNRSGNESARNVVGGMTIEVDCDAQSDGAPQRSLGDLNVASDLSIDPDGADVDQSDLGMFLSYLT